MASSRALVSAALYVLNMKRYTEKSFSPDASDLNHEGYKEGCKYYKQGDFKRARHAFETALEYWPLDPQAWFALGNCYDELKKPSKAEDCFRKSLKYTSQDKLSDVYCNLGNSLYDQNKLSEAIDFYSKVSAQSTAYRQHKKIWHLQKINYQVTTHNQWLNLTLLTSCKLAKR